MNGAGSRPMTFTALDIQREHQAALAALTAEQRHALERLRAAKQKAHFNGRFPTENLRDIFAAEAAARSDVLAA